MSCEFEGQAISEMFANYFCLHIFAWIGEVEEIGAYNVN